MPIRYACSEVGCAALVSRGKARCPKHDRPSSHARGYSRQWSVRAALFRQAFPLCGDRPDGKPPVGSQCWTATPRRLTPAACVDHVLPHRGDPSLFWNERDNWQSLCLTCHAAKSVGEGERGKGTASS